MAYGEYSRCLAYCNTDPSLEQIGWYCFNAGGRARPVGELVPNAWGLYDVAGNVSEWVYDKSDGLGPQEPTDPVVDGLGHATRELRGGAFHLWAGESRMANPGSGPWNGCATSIGFRLVRTLR